MSLACAQISGLSIDSRIGWFHTMYRNCPLGCPRHVGTAILAASKFARSEKMLVNARGARQVYLLVKSASVVRRAAFFLFVSLVRLSRVPKSMHASKSDQYFEAPARASDLVHVQG